MKVALQSYQNPKGRQVVYTSETIQVLSECCNSPIQSDRWNQWVDAAGNCQQGYWMICTACMSGLEENKRKWVTRFRIQDYLDFGTNRGWGPWGLYMFGLDDFEMEIKG